MSNVDYWASQPTDQPWTLNGFNGTWSFSDHKLIPDGLRNFIVASFPKIERFNRIPLEEINKLMNEVWEGPGSMPKIVGLYNELQAKRQGKYDISVKNNMPKALWDELPEDDDEEDDSLNTFG